MRWVVVFLVVALILEFWALPALAVAAAAVAKLLFVLFVVLFVVLFFLLLFASSRAEEAESSCRWSV
jgi:uncharacterized membrane protein YtjA (UPF0391 family)